jgi:hypothetical protein
LVKHKASDPLRYGELAKEAALIKLDKEPAIKTPDQYKLMGKSMPRLHIPMKINGTAIYGIDIKVLDIVHAAITACPVFWRHAQECRRVQDHRPAWRPPVVSGLDCNGLCVAVGPCLAVDRNLVARAVRRQLLGTVRGQFRRSAVDRRRLHVNYPWAAPTDDGPRGAVRSTHDHGWRCCRRHYRGGMWLSG